MSVLQRYLANEITRAVLFVLLALLVLFSFFDLMLEMQSVTKAGYQMQHALLYVALGMPGYVYEYMPIAVLIGTIYVLAQLASNSEYTIMRAAGMSTSMAGRMLLRIGLVFVIITFVFGELVSPYASKLAEKIKLSALGAAQAQEFRSGLWTKDLVRDNGLHGQVVGSRIVNIREILPNRKMTEIKIFEFDNNFHFTKEIRAASADYLGNNLWRLFDVSEVFLPNTLSESEVSQIHSRKMPTLDVQSEITPDILAVLFADPDRMSAYNLALFSKHLSDNKQDSKRYQIAFWKKVTYPFTALVMMALALPFAYLHARIGGVSLKIFSGIMLGLSFYLSNGLFSSLGLLNAWPALVTAVLPGLFFLAIAITTLWVIERR